MNGLTQAHFLFSLGLSFRVGFSTDPRVYPASLLYRLLLAISLSRSSLRSILVYFTNGVI
jgi:hypothetical protein